MKTKDLSFFVTRFFTHYLTAQKNVSRNTVKAYRDTFMLLFTFINEQKKIRTEKLTIIDISKEMVCDFLNWLEKDRHNSISTRNQRLAAVHAFFKFLQAENPDLMLHCRQVLSIPFKGQPKPLIQHLEENELKAILEAPNSSTIWGRRDLVLLSVLYDTGARVQEIIDLTIGDIRFETPAVVRLTGKGKKTRAIPLMSRTALLLRSYIDEQNFTANDFSRLVFLNKQGQKLTRNGVAYILDKYVNKAFAEDALPNFNITPHVLRHTKAMHLLRADVNMFYIRDILGHVDVSTTEIYARVDAEKKRGILEKISNNSIPTNIPKWQEDPTLMGWLKDLVK